MDPHNRNQLLNQRFSKLQTEFILIDHGLCPDWSREEHTRMRDSIYLILDGEGKITINGETLYPKRNDMVLLPRGSRVSLFSENESCYNKYWCDFIMKLDGRSFFDIIDFPYLIHLENNSGALALFNKLDKLHMQTDAASVLVMKAALIELVSMFLQNNAEETKKNKKYKLFADGVRDFISSRLEIPLSVGETAAAMGYNEKYFIELFKKVFGTTPAKYIKSARLENAKYELLYTDGKISYIISKIGYSTPQKFSRDFKEYTGFSPAEYRKLFR